MPGIAVVEAKIANDHSMESVPPGMKRLVEEELEAAGVEGQFKLLVLHARLGTAFNQRRGMIASYVEGPSIRVRLQPGDCETCREGWLMPCGDLTPEQVFEALHTSKADQPAPEEEQPDEPVLLCVNPMPLINVIDGIVFHEEVIADALDAASFLAAHCSEIGDGNYALHPSAFVLAAQQGGADVSLIQSLGAHIASASKLAEVEALANQHLQSDITELKRQKAALGAEKAGWEEEIKRLQQCVLEHGLKIAEMAATIQEKEADAEKQSRLSIELGIVLDDPYIEKIANAARAMEELQAVLTA